MTMAASNVDDDYASPKSSGRFVKSADGATKHFLPSSDTEGTTNPFSIEPPATFVIPMNNGTSHGDGTGETEVREECENKSGDLGDEDGRRRIDTQWKRIGLRKEGYLSDHSSSVDSLMTLASQVHQQVATGINRALTFESSVDAECRFFNADCTRIPNCEETNGSEHCQNTWENGTDTGLAQKNLTVVSRINGQNEFNVCVDSNLLPSHTTVSDETGGHRSDSFRVLPSSHYVIESSKSSPRRMSLGILSVLKDKQWEEYPPFKEIGNRKASDGKRRSAGDILSPLKGRRPMNQGVTEKGFEKQERVNTSSPSREADISKNSAKNVHSPPTAVDRINRSPRTTGSAKQCSCSRGQGERAPEQDRRDITGNSPSLVTDKDPRQVRQKLREVPDTVKVIPNKPAVKKQRSPLHGSGSPWSGEPGEQGFPSWNEVSPGSRGRNRENLLPCEKCKDCGEPHYDRYPYLHKYSEYLSREAGTYGENDASKSKGTQRMDSRVETPVASLLYRSRSLPRLSVHDSGLGSGNENTQGPGQPHNPKQLVADLRQLLTLKQHYYPEGGWGWVILFVGILVQILSHGTQGAVGVLLQHVAAKFGPQVHLEAGWLGAMSTGVALLVSPVTIAFCRRKSTRVTAVMGGLVTALGCLFTSFASQFHQLFFSYGTVVGIGVGMTRDCSTLMVAQYFKRRRELVEIFIVSGSGLGIAVMSAFIKGAISKIGWRLGLQAVTGVVFLTFILGTFYRSASLYHPQRRAILHLKNQKRKIKDKNKGDDRPPFFDFSTLRSKTVRILLVSTGISAFGINTPIFYLAHQAEEEGLGDTVVLLQAYLGLAWTLGCVAFGLLVVHRNVECRIARQYLTQAAVFVCGLCILALTAVQGNYHGYVMFAWIYGIFCGGYHYSLKMYTYERVRARNFARTWGFVQCSQAIPIAIGVPISGYMNVGCGGKAGYYFSSTCVLVGSFTLFFIDLHKRNVLRHKHTRANGTKHLCVSDNCPQRRRLSFSQEPDNDGTHPPAPGATATALVLGTDLAPPPGEVIDALGADKPELTCISEEGIADMDLPDNLLEDLDYIGDCITSCNKVENYLMLSEFENNLIAEMPIIMDRRGRRWSLARSKPGPTATCGSQSTGNDGNSGIMTSADEEEAKSKYRLANAPPSNRMITVIDEASA